MFSIPKNVAVALTTQKLPVTHETKQAAFPSGKITDEHLLSMKILPEVLYDKMVSVRDDVK